VRVALDVRALEEPRLAERGIGRYVRSLRDAMRGEQSVDLVELERLRRPPAPERVRELYEHALLARDVRAAKAEVLHQPTIDLVTLRPGVPLAVTLHDLVPLKQPGRYLRTGLKHRLRYAAVRRANRVIVPSAAVAGDARRLLGVEAEVVHEAPAAAFRPREDAHERASALGLPERYLLWVGGLNPPDPRKGVAELARAVGEASGQLPLVLAGRASEEARGLARPDRVVLAGRLSDDELAAVYGAAEVLLFPSEDEGFGLPPVEALACGTPVAAYAVGALPEVLAGAEGAELLEPGDLKGLLAAAGRLAGSEARGAGRTWADVARETAAVLRRAVA